MYVSPKGSVTVAELLAILILDQKVVGLNPTSWVQLMTV